MIKKDLSAFGAIVCLSVLSLINLTSCWDEYHPGTYYTFQGKTVASDLMDNPNYSDFVRILERANVLNDLKVYGNNTCFAPDNKAIADFLKEREAIARREGKDVTYNTVDDLPQEDCDTLAWTHLLDITCYVNDLEPGLLPKVNLNDRFLILTLDSTLVEQLGDSVYALERHLNNAIIIAKDDSCENGVVHYIDRCIDFSGNYVYDLVDNDPKTVLFSEALKLCGFHKKLSEWYDYSYTIGQDSVIKGVKLMQVTNEYTVFYWAKRKTGFTLLVPVDSIFRANGVNNVIPDMFELAKSIYGETDDAEIMSDYANPKNPLYKFLSYHILPFVADLSRINGRSDVMQTHNAGKTDPEDYFETFLPKSLVRISTKLKNGVMDMDQIYINSRGNEGNGTVGFKGAKERGIRILNTQEMRELGVSNNTALNGVYHYVDSIMKYDTYVREEILDRRMRIDCTTLSPDFITSGARQFDSSITGVKYYGSGFKDPKNFASYHTDYTLSVRSTAADKSYAYEGDGIDIEGQFDIYVKLPPVPHDGTWQLRLSYRGNKRCGIIQNYLACVPVGQEVSRSDWKPLGIPVDLRFDNLNETPAVGWIKDEDLENAAAVEALDKSMKNRGWLKGSIAQRTDDGDLHRDVRSMGRMILTTDYMKSNMDYYLRIKQILDNNKAQFLFDFIELVPKSVYDGHEDKN